MPTSIETPSAVRVWFDKENLWLLLKDGRQVGTPLKFYPRLAAASVEQRQFELSGGGIGLHWPALDEDLSVDGILRGIRGRTKTDQ